ncbi:MAG TPA: hypothetical protein VKA30_05940 [Actinomycetota bacterium]|nr:hypothetical protein [Actinomycetota bacterium]
MSQGSYRIFIPGGELVESFVAAPGPAGWRYFGRVHEPGSEREQYVVDHVTDLDWRLIRLRLLGPGRELVVERSPNGVHVIGPDEVAEFDGVDVVWSPSPWSVKVLAEHLKGEERAVDAVRVGLDGPAERIRVELRRGEGAHGTALVVDGSTAQAVYGPDVPERVEGWFELLVGG